MYSERVELFHLEQSVSSFHACWVEHFELNFSFHHCRVAYCTDCVQFCIEFCWRHTGWMSTEHCWNYTKSSVHLFMSGVQSLWKIALTQLYEEIVGNPASSSSDTSKSDPVSFQFKESRQTECREEDFFARARSRPDPRIISHALAGKKHSRAAILRHVCRVWNF